MAFETVSLTIHPAMLVNIDVAAYEKCKDKREDIFIEALEFIRDVICPVDMYFRRRPSPGMPTLPSTITVKMPKKMFKLFNRLSMMEGEKLERIIYKALIELAFETSLIFRLYSNSYIDTLMAVLTELRRHRQSVDPGFYLGIFGAISTMIIDFFGIPNQGDVLDLDRIPHVEVRRQIIENITRARRLIGALGIDVFEYRGRVRSVMVRDVEKLARFYGVGTRVWAEPLVCKEPEIEEGEVTVTVDIDEQLRYVSPEHRASHAIMLATLIEIYGMSLDKIAVYALKHKMKMLEYVDRFHTKQYLPGKLKPFPSETVAMYIRAMYDPTLALEVYEKHKIPADILKSFIERLPLPERRPVTLDIKLEENLYKLLQKIHMLRKADRLDVTIQEYLYVSGIRYVGDLAQMTGAYLYKLLLPEALAEKKIREAVDKGLIKFYEPEKAAKLLGKFTTIYFKTFSLDPLMMVIPTPIPVDKIREEDLEKMVKVIEEDIGEKTDNPREYFRNLIASLKDIAPAFGIKIEEEEGVVKSVAITDPGLLKNFYGYGTKALEEPIEE